MWRPAIRVVLTGGGCLGFDFLGGLDLCGYRHWFDVETEVHVVEEKSPVDDNNDLYPSNRCFFYAIPLYHLGIRCESEKKENSKRLQICVQLYTHSLFKE